METTLNIISGTQREGGKDMNEETRSKVIITAYQGEGEIGSHEGPGAMCVILQKEHTEVMFLGQISGMEILQGTSHIVEAAVNVLVSQGLDPDFVGDAVSQGIQHGILQAVQNHKKGANGDERNEEQEDNG